jgi:hypothetical protein
MNHQHFNKFMLVGVVVLAFALPLVVRSATYMHILVFVVLCLSDNELNIVGGFAGVLRWPRRRHRRLYLDHSVAAAHRPVGMLSALAIAGHHRPAGLKCAAPTLPGHHAFAEGFRVMVESILSA